METTKDNLIRKTIKCYLKHFGLKIKNGFIYKKDIAIYTEDLNNEKEVLSFLLGISSVLDSLDFWDLKIKVKGGKNGRINKRSKNPYRNEAI